MRKERIALTDLPFDILVEILTKLQPGDVLKLEQVCKFFRSEFQKEDERIWKFRVSKESDLAVKDFDTWNIYADSKLKKTWKAFFWTQARNYRFPIPSTPLGADIQYSIGEIMDISPDQKQAHNKLRPGIGSLQDHRRILLQPAIPNQGVHSISLEIKSTEGGTWVGVCCSSFPKHLWLGADRTSIAAGSHCPSVCYFKAESQPLPGLNFHSGDILSMKVDARRNELTYFINGKELSPKLGLNRLERQEGDNLHFAISFWMKPTTVKILSRMETDQLLHSCQ